MSSTAWPVEVPARLEAATTRISSDEHAEGAERAARERRAEFVVGVRGVGPLLEVGDGVAGLLVQRRPRRTGEYQVGLHAGLAEQLQCPHAVDPPRRSEDTDDHPLIAHRGLSRRGRCPRGSTPPFRSRPRRCVSPGSGCLARRQSTSPRRVGRFPDLAGRPDRGAYPVMRRLQAKAAVSSSVIVRSGGIVKSGNAATRWWSGAIEVRDQATGSGRTRWCQVSETAAGCCRQSD